MAGRPLEDFAVHAMLHFVGTEKLVSAPEFDTFGILDQILGELEQERAVGGRDSPAS